MAGSKRTLDDEAKETTSPSTATVAAAKKAKSQDDNTGSNDNRDYDQNKNSSPVPVTTTVSSNVNDCIHPMTPNFDPLVSNMNGAGSHAIKEYVIYLAVREGKQSPFAQGIAKCKSAPVHDTSIHTECLQMDGTRHITLWLGEMSIKDAANLKFAPSSSGPNAKTPIPVSFTGLTNWKSGVYLQVAPSLTAELKKMTKDNLFRGSVPKGRLSCDHMSLYRKRGFGNQAFPEMARVRKFVQHHNWGQLDGVSIRIKETGAGYDECRVLWEAED